MIGLLLSCAGGGVNETPATTGAAWMVSVGDHPVMALGALATVETGADCTVSMTFSSEGVDARTTAASAVGTLHTFEILALRADTRWSLTATGHCSGVSQVSEPVEYLTGPVPYELPEFGLEVPLPDAVTPGVSFLAPVSFGALDPPVFVGLDEQGEVVWVWQDPEGDSGHADPWMAALPDGTVVVVQHDLVKGMTWGGEELWSLVGRDLGLEELHHDAVVLDDGSVLALVQETQEVRVEGTLRPVVGDAIVQLSTDGEVLWRWSPFDHLDTTGLIAEDASDWIHANALLYRDGVVLLSSRFLDLLIAIDHATGELLWQLGEGGDFSLTSGQWFDGQHAPEWHDDGTLVVYDNGLDRETTRAVVYDVDVDARTLSQRWEWWTEAFTHRLGDANRMGDDHVLVTAGGPQSPSAPAIISEVDATGAVVWELSVPSRAVYRTNRVDWDVIR